jgi:WD40 repeat protein/tRNA A-37 threonylcarbamoyl transferase component Bud32
MRLGEHLVLGEIGRGGMGVVYKARTPEGSEVAIKLLRHDRATPQAVERFRREERLLGVLGDVAGFVPILGTVAVSGGIGFVMPLLEGTLRERLRQPLPLDEAISIVRTLAEAAGRAHERGIVHRDLKPENVLFTRDGRPLVADLGLAKHFLDSSAGASQSVSLTQDGVMKGTAGYMAPEQMKSAKDVGPTADVFALGAILYECVTGVPAFSATNLVELISRVDSAEHVPASQLRAGVPAWLERAIEAALDPDPARRPQGGAAFAALLAPRERSPRKAVAATIVVLLAALAAALVVRPRREEPRDAVASVTTATPSPLASVTVIPFETRQENIPRAYSGVGSRSRRWRLAQVMGHPRWKHTSTIQALAFSPTGDRLASGGLEWEARLWDARTGDDIRSVAGGSWSVQAIAFSPDGKRLALGTKGGRLSVHPVPPEGGPIVAPIHSGRAIVAVTFSPEGGRVIAVTQEGEVASSVIVKKQAKTTRTGGGFGNVVSVAFTADRATAILVADDGRVRLQATDGSTSFLLGGLDEHPVAVATLPDGRFVFAAGARLLFYDPARQEVVSRRDLPSRIVALAATPDGARLAVGLDPPQVVILDTKGDTSLSFAVQREPIRPLAFSPDGRLLAVGSEDQTIRVIETTRGLPVAWSDEDRAGSFVAANDDASRFATGTRDGVVRVWDRPTNAPTRRFPLHQAPIWSVDLSRDGALVLTSDESGLVVLAEAATGKVRWQFRAPADVVHEAALARDLSTAVLAGGDGTLFILDADTGAVRRTIKHGGPIYNVVLSRDGRKALVHAGGAWLDDLETGESREAAPGQQVSTAGTFSADGTLLALMSPQGEVALWGTDGKKRRSFKAHGLGPAQDLFAPSGALVTLAWDWSVRFWDPETGDKLDEIDLHAPDDVPVRAAISSDGRTLLVSTLRSVVLRFEAR